jgi:hypothetical protein
MSAPDRAGTSLRVLFSLPIAQKTQVTGDCPDCDKLSVYNC